MMKIIKMTMIFLITATFLGMKSKKMENSHSFNNTIECGFNSMTNKKKSFNIKFISIMLIFMMFDLEISIMTPMILTMKKNMLMNMMMTTMMITFMMTSMLYEIKMKSIKWI